MGVGTKTKIGSKYSTFVFLFVETYILFWIFRFQKNRFWVLANIIIMYMYLFKLLMTRFKANHNTLLYDDVDWWCKHLFCRQPPALDRR